VRAPLVVGADGRGSVVRERAGLHVDDLGAPMDVLWFRLSRRPGDPDQTMGRFDPGRIFVSIHRGEHWQFGYVVPKGGIEDTHRRGLAAFRAEIARLAPYAAGRVDELGTWDDVKLLTVKVDRLREWCRPGLLCIGDAAHAMSPVGGIGINLAVQDAVAAANLLWRPLRDNQLTVEHLRRVQRRRQFPTRLTQWLQVVVQTRIISPVLRTTTAFRPPLVLRLFGRFPWLRRFPARLVGIGVRPEHVRSPSIPV
jgi:2-polyprenyl-6-methoxyphenol hydroxylase-like FAD-dependent oxidoreductase